MADKELEAPKPHWFVTVVNTILQVAIDGIGASAAITAITAQVPWLPVNVTSWFVNLFLGDFEKQIEIGSDKIAVRFGKQLSKMQVDQALADAAKEGKMTDAELQNAKDALHKLLHHGGD